MSNVVDFDERAKQVNGLRGDIAKGGGGGDNGGMETRLARLEILFGTLATKEDLARSVSDQTWKIVTFIVGLVTVVGSALVAATYFIATHVK